MKQNQGRSKYFFPEENQNIKFFNSEAEAKRDLVLDLGLEDAK